MNYSLSLLLLLVCTCSLPKFKLVTAKGSSARRTQKCLNSHRRPCEENRCPADGRNYLNVGEWPSYKPVSALINDTNFQNAVKLDKLRIGAIGDSISLQAFVGLRCYLSRIAPSVKFEYRQFLPLHTIFMDRDGLYQYLKEGLVDVDIAFLGVGTWYLNAESDIVNGDGSAVANNNTRISQLISQCLIAHNNNNPSSQGLPETLRYLLEPPPKGSGSEYDVCHDAKETEAFAYAKNRRRCGEILLGTSAFSIDFALLNEVLEYDRKTEKALPPIIWKDIPPQHFPFALSGKWMKSPPRHSYHNTSARYVGGSSAMLPELTTNVTSEYLCAPIQSRSTAYSLNAIADNLIVNHGNSSSGFAGVARSWEFDVKAWDLHPIKDCTHYCSKSIVVRNWAALIIEAMVESPRFPESFHRSEKRRNYKVKINLTGS